MKHTKDVICQEVLLGQFLVGLVMCFNLPFVGGGFFEQEAPRHCLSSSLNHDGFHPLVFCHIFFEFPSTCLNWMLMFFSSKIQWENVDLTTR